MKYSKHIIIFSFVAVFIIIACKTKKEIKTTTTPIPVVVEEPKAPVGIVSYETLKPLLAKSCNTSGCHDESRRRMNFKIYDNLKYFGAKGEIKTHVLEIKNMPPDETLTAAELDLFKRWIADGMTEK
ncbi:MAG: hypothetical protein H0W73_03350 [Bacteroidetes bacterium]|nr:hypothetical protein [Bacteroidota bacterium]